MLAGSRTSKNCTHPGRRQRRHAFRDADRVEVARDRQHLPVGRHLLVLPGDVRLHRAERPRGCRVGDVVDRDVLARRRVRQTTWEDTLTLARLYRAALEHLGVRGYPKTTGKRGIHLDPHRAQSTTSMRRVRGWSVSVGRSARPSLQSILVGVVDEELAGARPASITRRTRASRRSWRRIPCVRPPVPRCRRRSRGTSSTTPTYVLDRWTIRDLPARVAKVGDLFAAAQTDSAGAAAGLRSGDATRRSALSWDDGADHRSTRIHVSAAPRPTRSRAASSGPIADAFSEDMSELRVRHGAPAARARAVRQRLRWRQAGRQLQPRLFVSADRAGRPGRGRRESPGSASYPTTAAAVILRQMMTWLHDDAISAWRCGRGSRGVGGGDLPALRVRTGDDVVHVQHRSGARHVSRSRMAGPVPPDPDGGRGRGCPALPGGLRRGPR